MQKLGVWLGLSGLCSFLIGLLKYNTALVIWEERTSYIFIAAGLGIFILGVLVFSIAQNKYRPNNQVLKIDDVDSGDITNDAYRIFLTKKYGIEKNLALNKIICGNSLFDNIDDALIYADSLCSASKSKAVNSIISDKKSAKWTRKEKILIILSPLIFLVSIVAAGVLVGGGLYMFDSISKSMH